MTEERSKPVQRDGNHSDQNRQGHHARHEVRCEDDVRDRRNAPPRQQETEHDGKKWYEQRDNRPRERVRVLVERGRVDLFGDARLGDGAFEALPRPRSRERRAPLRLDLPAKNGSACERQEQKEHDVDN